MNEIVAPALRFEQQALAGTGIVKTERRIRDLGDIYFYRDAWKQMPGDELVYEVESYLPVADGTEGGLFLGITRIHPGKVGREYFMTKGHFHKIRNRAEIYMGMEGEGMLILMDEHRHTWAEKMFPGSLHYIHANIAHRTANTGNTVFSFGAVWPADAGHDYATISEGGFSKILVEQQQGPVLIDRI